MGKARAVGVGVGLAIAAVAGPVLASILSPTQDGSFGLSHFAPAGAMAPSGGGMPGPGTPSPQPGALHGSRSNLNAPVTIVASTWLPPAPPPAAPSLLERIDPWKPERPLAAAAIAQGGDLTARLALDRLDPWDPSAPPRAAAAVPGKTMRLDPSDPWNPEP